MMTVPAAEVARSYATLRDDPRVGDTAQEGMELLRTLFGAASTPGTRLAVQALAGDVPVDRIRQLMPSYIAAALSS